MRRHRGDHPGNRGASREDEEDDVRERRLRPGCPAGELIQLVTIDCDYSDKNDYDPYVLINPVIVEQSDHLVPFSEGCLSIPGISCEIERPDHVVVEAYDLDANLIRYEASGDLFCVCLQHEIDHLHGNTMFERLKPMQRIKAVKEYQDALARGARPGETE